MQKNNIILALAGVILILGVLFTGCTNYTGSSSQPTDRSAISLDKNFTSTSDKFSIKYPSDWNITAGNVGNFNRTTFRPPENNETRLSVNVNPNVPNRTLSDWVNWRINVDNTSFENYNMISEQKTSLNGNPAVNIISTEKILTDLKTMKVITVVNGTMYEVIYAATPDRFEKDLKVAYTMMQSITFGK